MDKKDLKEIIALFEASNLQQMIYKAPDCELKLSKNATPLYANESQAIEGKTELDETFSDEERDEWLLAVRSPLVGVVYQSPSPDEPAFVQIGDSVKKGDTVCIIETMKIMNEIPAPCDGEIQEVSVQDEQVVEYDQVLVKIKPSH